MGKEYLLRNPSARQAAGDDTAASRRSALHEAGWGGFSVFYLWKSPGFNIPQGRNEWQRASLPFPQAFLMEADHHGSQWAPVNRPCSRPFWLPEGHQVHPSFVGWRLAAQFRHSELRRPILLQPYQVDTTYEFRADFENAAAPMSTLPMDHPASNEPMNSAADASRRLDEPRSTSSRRSPKANSAFDVLGIAPPKSSTAVTRRELHRRDHRREETDGQPG